jgi:nucleoside-diphosphate-sugar epimerase
LIRAAFATIFGRNDKLPQILIPCRFESRLKPLRYTNQRAREILGWTPPVSLHEGLARTFEPAPAHASQPRTIHASFR